MNTNKDNIYQFKKELRKDWYLLVLIIFMFIVSIIVFSELPEKVPVHWNLQGDVDGYANRFWGAFMLPLLNLGMLIIMLVTPLIDPNKKNYLKFGSSYRIIRSVIIIFIAALHFLVLAFALGHNINIGNFVFMGVGMLFIILGNYLPKVRHNYFLGIKVPWTLADEKVWKKTHRLAGKLFLLSGIIIFLSIFFSDNIRFWVLMICVFGSSLVSTVYSYLIYQKGKDRT